MRRLSAWSDSRPGNETGVFAHLGRDLARAVNLRPMEFAV